MTKLLPSQIYLKLKKIRLLQPQERIIKTGKSFLELLNTKTVSVQTYICFCYPNFMYGKKITGLMTVRQTDP
jgi:hypothetical protein